MVELQVFWHISLQRCFGLEQFGHTQIQCVSDLYGWLIYKFAYFFLQKYNKSKIQNFGQFTIEIAIHRHATLKKIELTYVWFMSYSTCWNCCRTWNLCFLFIFSWKKLQLNFAFWDTFKLLRCLNSKEIKLQSSIRVICILLDLISVQLKI